MDIFTIGFAGKTAEQFFEPLRRNNVELLVDVRLNNVSQLAGFTKKQDLPYLLDLAGGIAYRHELSLAPAREDLKAYRAREIDWDQYAERYLHLLAERAVAKELHPSELAPRIALLCSESTPDKCHRRLAAEYLQANWQGIAVTHL